MLTVVNLGTYCHMCKISFLYINCNIQGYDGLTVYM